MRRTLRLAMLYLLEAVSALLALVILVGAAVLWRWLPDRSMLIFCVPGPRRL